MTCAITVFVTSGKLFCEHASHVIVRHYEPDLLSPHCKQCLLPYLFAWKSIPMRQANMSLAVLFLRKQR